MILVLGLVQVKPECCGVPQLFWCDRI